MTSPVAGLMDCKLILALLCSCTLFITGSGLQIPYIDPHTARPTRSRQEHQALLNLCYTAMKHADHIGQEH